MYLAGLDQAEDLHGFLILVLFMHPAVMLDRRPMIFTQEQEEAEDLEAREAEVILVVVALVELARTQTVAEVEADPEELSEAALLEEHQAATSTPAQAAEEVAEVLRDRVTLEV
jgi:hypothetical protein